MLTSITITILIITGSSDAYAEPKKTYYSDGYGYHEIPYDLKYGEITNLDCNDRGLTFEINTDREGEVKLYVPATLLDMRSTPLIDIIMTIQTASGLWDYRRDVLDESLKLTFKVEEGYSQARIQTYYNGDCKISPPEGIHYRLNSPKIQLENWISPQKIICKKDLVLMFKTSDRSSICVKPETKKILAEREHYDEMVWIGIAVHCHKGCNVPNWINSQEYAGKSLEDRFLLYFKNENIEILDVKTRCVGSCFCEEGECAYVMEHFFQMFKRDFEKIAEEGFDLYSDNQFKPKI